MYPKMAITRALYVTFYILYLFLLAIGLWFLFYFEGIPSWIWILFGVAFLLLIIAVLIKETLTRKVINSRGEIMDYGMFKGWGVFVFILNLMALILVIIGIILVIINSKTIPWWVWLLLGLAVLFSFLGNIISAGGGIVFPLIFGLIALGLFITGGIFYVIYSQAPWWVWVIISVAIIFSILAGAFESLSQKENAIIAVSCDDPRVECITYSPTRVDVATLPASSIPEQMV